MMRDLEKLRGAVQKLGENVIRLRVRAGDMSDREQVVASYRRLMNKRDMSERALNMALYVTTKKLEAGMQGVPTERFLDEAENFVDHATSAERQQYEKVERQYIEDYCAEQGIAAPYAS